MSLIGFFILACIAAAIVLGLMRMDVVDEAAWLTEAERQEGVRRVRAKLAVEGAADCIGCGDEIDADRRAAMPSAHRCTLCQTRVERLARGRAGRPVVGGEL